MGKKLVHKKENIVTSTIRVSVIVVVIKILGFIKQVIIASRFGASLETDAFFISTGVINSLANVLFSAISVTLLSLYTQKVVEKGKEKANLLISATIKKFIPISIVIFLLFFILAPKIGKILAPTYDGYILELLASYIRIMAGSFVLNCYYLTINVILESNKSFLPGKVQAFFQNLFLIIAALFFSDEFGVKALVIAFILAAVAQCIFITFCVKNTYHFSWNTIESNGDVSKLIRLSIPLILGNAVYELNDIVDKQIASGQGNGMASILSYGASINEIVTTVIIMSLSTVLFSYYATWVARKECKKIEENIKKSMEYLVLFIVPIFSVCLLSGEDIVRILYGRGNFGDSEIRETYAVLIGYAIGFIFQASRATTVRVFYAFKDTKIPMINGVISVAVNIVLSIWLSRIIGVAGVSWATSISMAFASCQLFYYLSKYIKGFSLKSSLPEYAKAIVGGIISSIIVYILKINIEINYLLSFIICGAATVLAYFFLLLIFRSKCIYELLGKVMR